MITSLANERVKFIRKLHERKTRLESGLFFVEGLRIVVEAVDEGAEIDTLVVAPELLKNEFGQQFAAEQQARGIPIFEVGADVFRRISMKDGPQGLAAVVRQKWIDLRDIPA